jgi:transcriptional regulator GlxA family with amidase domain
MSAQVRRVSVVLFEGFELLDVFGPVQLLGIASDRVSVELVGPREGLVRSAQGTQVAVSSSYATAAEPDIVLVPGGMGTRALAGDVGSLAWLAAWARPAALVTSVCTGSAVLAAAGLLDGYRATAALMANLFGQDVADLAATVAELEVHRDAAWDPFARVHGLVEP